MKAVHHTTKASFLGKDSRWTNWQLGLLKLCMASLYLVVGALFPALFLSIKWVLLAVFILSSIFLLLHWYKQMTD